jgi:recombination protein RecR
MAGQPNMNAMLKQVQKMQADMVKAQEELKNEVVEASAGGGMVTVKISGDLEVREVRIDPEAVDPDDAELLQDMVLAAMNEAIRSAQELAANKMNAAAGGLAGPGGLGGLGLPGFWATPAAGAARFDRLFAAPVNRLITELARLPGIGQRTAQRLAFHILSASEEEALALADAIREVKETVGHCEICFNLATEATCRICQDERREAATICVVEQPSDVIPIERSGEFHGRYHVLGGALSPIDGVDPEDLHISELLGRVSNGAGVSEVVIATNATTTGEATALYLADALRERAPALAVTRLASGLPVGSDLEYADEITLGRALRGRQAL